MGELADASDIDAGIVGKGVVSVQEKHCWSEGRED
jgi:hypothetical protein